MKRKEEQKEKRETKTVQVAQYDLRVGKEGNRRII
jgi:hypothetical protein